MAHRCSYNRGPTVFIWVINIHDVPNWSVCTLIQGHSKLFTTGQDKLNSEYYVIKCVGGRYIWHCSYGFIPIVVCHCKSTKLINHTNTPSITYFCTTEYLVHIKINRVRGRPMIFHLLIWLFYLLYCNITSLTSPKITLALLFNTCFL